VRSKLKLLLTRRHGVTDRDLDARILAEIDALSRRASRPLAIQRAYAIADADLYKVAAGAFDAELPSMRSWSSRSTAREAKSWCLWLTASPKVLAT
jgi:hypothetical protein